MDFPFFLAAEAASSGSLDPASYLGLVLVLGVIAQWIAYKMRIPSILLLLVLGFVLGRFTNPDELFGQKMLFAGVSLAVAVVLFEGGLSLHFKDLRESGRGVLRLCTVGWIIAWPMISVAAWLLGFDWRVATLVGAILIVTGPTVVGPILRSMKPTRKVGSLAKWEGIVVDPIGAMLAVLVFQAVLTSGAEEAFWAVVSGLLTTLAVGFGIAVALGFMLEQFMKRHAIPDFLHGVVFLAVAGGAFVLSNQIQSESGLLTVTVLGIWLGNRKGYDLEHVIEFKEHLRTLFVGALFIVLAGRIGTRELLDILPVALIFLAILVFVVRPTSVFVSLLGTTVNWKERTIMASLAPRGIVAAAVTSIFALEFSNVAEKERSEATEALELGQNVEATQHAALAEMTEGLANQAGELVPLVFVVIVGTVAIYGLGATPIARRLGLAMTNPQGVLFAGASSWVVQSAKLLRELDFQVTIVDSNYDKLSAARMAGVPAVTANILSEYAVEDMDFSGMGKMIATTPNDEVNATASREFAHHFGRANVFQLARSKENRSGSVRREAVDHLSSRHAFVPSLSWAEMERRCARGMVVKRTPLSENFTLEDFRRSKGEEAVILFVIRDGKLAVAHSEGKLPENGGMLIALVPGNDEAAEHEQKLAEHKREADAARDRDRDREKTEEDEGPQWGKGHSTDSSQSDKEIPNANLANKPSMEDD